MWELLLLRGSLGFGLLATAFLRGETGVVRGGVVGGSVWGVNWSYVDRKSFVMVYRCRCMLL